MEKESSKQSPKEALRKTDISGSLLSEIRQAVAAYMQSEGCSCCRSENHDENGERLAVLLGVKKYDDGISYDWESVSHATPEEIAAAEWEEGKPYKVIHANDEEVCISSNKVGSFYKNGRFQGDTFKHDKYEKL